MIVKVVNHIDLLLNYFGKNPIFNSKEPDHPVVTPFFNFGLNTHPERDSCYNLQHNTPETPNVNSPRIFVFVHFLQHLLIVLQLVLKEDVVQNLRRHVLWRGHRKLLEIGEEKAASEVD